MYVNNKPLSLTDPSGNTIYTKSNELSAVSQYLAQYNIAGFDKDTYGDMTRIGNSPSLSHGGYDIKTEILWRMIISDRIFSYNNTYELNSDVVFRTNVVEAAQSVKFGFSTSPSVPNKYEWSAGQFKTQYPANAIDLWFSDKASDYNTGCKMGAELVVLKALLDTIGPLEFNRHLKRQIAVPSDRQDVSCMAQFALENSPASLNHDWVPGDWGYIDNTLPAKEAGEEGLNIIYIGGTFKCNSALMQDAKSFWALTGPGGSLSSLDAFRDMVDAWGNAHITSQRAGISKMMRYCNYNNN